MSKWIVIYFTVYLVNSKLPNPPILSRQNQAMMTVSGKRMSACRKSVAMTAQRPPIAE